MAGDPPHPPCHAKTSRSPSGQQTPCPIIDLGDYGMRGGSVDLKVRRALAYYTKHRLGLDLDPKARRPEDQHVVLIQER
jgi:hypothetical protein